MACSCAGRKYVAIAPDGTRTEYKTQAEAAAAAQRSGGTWRKA